MVANKKEKNFWAFSPKLFVDFDRWTFKLVGHLKGLIRDRKKSSLKLKWLESWPKWISLWSSEARPHYMFFRVPLHVWSVGCRACMYVVPRIHWRKKGKSGADTTEVVDERSEETTSVPARALVSHLVSCIQWKKGKCGVSKYRVEKGKSGVSFP